MMSVSVICSPSPVLLKTRHLNSSPSPRPLHPCIVSVTEAPFCLGLQNPSHLPSHLLSHHILDHVVPGSGATLGISNSQHPLISDPRPLFPVTPSSQPRTFCFRIPLFHPSPEPHEQLPASSGSLGFPGGSDGKASACDAGDLGSIPGSGRSPGEGSGSPLQYCCLENSMD